ncbi:C2 domain containing protein [Oryctes borbonicus]|uniref:C2 domain containing protein n=1 Tax=Oryctes borbonicus TaxID=1629725 RepID=A0A0T6BBW0_9SCAR|nr:C2 domain containing protein [Oryctes borbonicus]
MQISAKAKSFADDVSLSEAHSSPMLASRSGTKSATPSPIAPSSRRTTGSVSSQEWRSNDEDIDRLVVPNRSSLSSLGLRSDSMASVYSGAFDGKCTVAVKGQVEFGLQYNYKTCALEILVKQCRDLAAVDVKRNRSDPYVKVYLLPDKSKSGKRKTKVKKHTLNPVFDECLKFHIALNGLETRTLWLTVWHSDMFGRNDFLGEVMMALENKVFDDPTPKWYTLQERTEPFDDMLSFKGDILVGLKFVPPDMTDRHKKGKRSRGALHVLIKEAKSLTAVKANGTSDPFCKSYLLPDKGRSSKQKTTVVKKTVNPIWNHTFIYDDVTLQELAERCLELTVWDHDRLASNEFLGGVRFSLGTGKHYGKPVDWMDATGKEVSLWKSMLERPNFWVEGCLSLRPTLDQRSTQ